MLLPKNKENKLFIKMNTLFFNSFNSYTLHSLLEDKIRRQALIYST